ncbi:MAG: hypothetical protein WCK21_06730 [Actinomycetota bacterium]
MPSNPFTDPNWAPDLADTVERTVGKIRSLTTDNAVKVSRAIVFGVLVVICLLVAAPLGTILFVRFAQVVLSRMTRTDHPTTVWLSYMITGGLMMIIGTVLLRLRHKKPDAA